MTGTAGNEKVTITGSTSTSKEGWTAGGSLTLTASRTATCNATKQFLAFSGTPTVTYTATTSSGASATPKVKATLASVGSCTSAGKDNELKITFTNTVTLKHTGTTAGTAIFIISGIKYAAGATDVHGPVSVATATATFAASNPSPTGTPDNADIAYAYVSTTPVSVSAGAFDHATTPVKVVEAKGHTVPTGYVCLTLSTGTFNTSASASVKTTGGGTAGSAVSYKTTDKTAMFDVTKMSTATHPSTFTVSGLAVNAPSGSTATVTVTARDGETATCATTTGTSTLLTTAVGATASPNTETVLSTLPGFTQIYGATAAATAVKLLETSFTATAGHCPGTATTANDNRPVVIATETHFQDALSAQYLASDLKTGVLLTSYGSLPSVTIQALKTEGVTQVDIVGGPLAVSTAVEKQLMALPAYTCGGTSQLKTSGHVRTISVTRIYGQTAEGTAQAIDSLVPSTHVATEAFVTAYVGVNSNKGIGMFNTTAGLSSAPTTSAAVPTVIMASGAEFQDAMAASTLSYWRAGGKSLPIVLTSPTSLTSNAAGALATTGAKQVILMGGQLAVTNSVVTTLVSDGIEVLRIAGQNYTGTAAELAKFEYATAPKGLDWESTTVAVARGNGFTDGLVGAVVAGNTGVNYYGTATTPEPLLLTLSPTTVGATLTAFLKAYGATGPTATASMVSSLQIFGGPLAVSPAVISKMLTDIS
jgi:putative cell wall-binding protein